MKIRLRLFWVLVLWAHVCFSQDQGKIDSLQIELQKFEDQKVQFKGKVPPLFDTIKVNILSSICEEYWLSPQEKGLDYANQLLIFSQKAGIQKGIVKAYSSLGAIYFSQGNINSSLEYSKKGLALAEETGYTSEIAFNEMNIGNVYLFQGIYPEALQHFLIALRIYEEAKDKKRIASCYNNIGNIYSNQLNYPEALANYLAALAIMKEIGYKEGIAVAYGNIAICYQLEGQYAQGLENYMAALSIWKELDNKSWIAMTVGNIGTLEVEQGNFSEALKNLSAALKLNEEVGNKAGVGYWSYNLGSCYLKQGKYSEAIQYLERGLSLSRETGELNTVKEIYRDWAILDSAQGNYAQAFLHYKNFIAARDSLYNEENTRKTVQLQMQYDFDKKEALTKVEQGKELQKQKLLRNGFVGGTFLFLMLAGAIFMGLVKTGKAKKKSEELLLNILPAEVAEELKVTGTAKAKAYTMVTVMLTDFKDFTNVSEKVSAELLVDEIHTCFSAFDHIIHKYKIEKIKTIGDAYLCASGLPVSNYTHATDMIKAAFEIRDFMLQRKREKESRGEIPFELRIGIHTGPVVAGIVGVKKYAYDIWGDTVNVAARLEQNSEPGKVNISGTTYELVKEKFTCTHRGKIEAKHKGEIDMYFVEAI